MTVMTIIFRRKSVTKKLKPRALCEPGLYLVAHMYMAGKEKTSVGSTRDGIKKMLSKRSI